MSHFLESYIGFPDVNMALTEPNGLLAQGGDLSVNLLMSAYRQGIFPWFMLDEPIMWWSPDPRAVFYPKHFDLNRSLKKFLNKCDYQITVNCDFLSVITHCAGTHGETWITDEMIEAYYQLHQLGFAHSIEVWQNNDLIGGLYGVAQGALFCGESMFSLQSNASKVALYTFCQHFMAHNGQLIDSQILNEHTASLGAIEIPRSDYLNHLNRLQKIEISPLCWQRQMISYEQHVNTL